MREYTPAFYRRPATLLSLNLGSTADLVTSTNQLVQTVKANTDAVPDIKKDVADARLAVEAAGKAIESSRNDVLRDLAGVNPHTDQQVGAAATTILNGVQGQLDKAAAEIVKQVLAGNAVPTPFGVGECVVHLVRLLVQVAALALDKSPGEPSPTPKKSEWKENVAIDVLRGAAVAAIDEAKLSNTPLGQRVLDAFRRFDAVDLPARSRRFVEVHGLMRELGLTLRD